MYSDLEHLPAVARSGDPSQFNQYLADTGQSFVLGGPLHDQRAHLRFTGPFHGQQVVWDCEFVTLESVAAGQAADAGGVRNFIEIGEPGPQGVPLRVGLGISRIDVPAIEKMIIMIRNYRNLHYDRHEYGEPHSPVSPAP